MKRIILLAFVFLTILEKTFSQDSTWTKTDAAWYGTPKEKREQEAISNKVGYELYRLIGFKEYYANGISSYLQENGYNMDDTKLIPGGTEFIFSQRIGFGKAPKIYLRYWANKQKRITKVRITGYPYGLASLFIKYWPTDIQWSSTSQLTKGIVATKMLINEVITYNYKEAFPYIEISK